MSFKLIRFLSLLLLLTFSSHQLSFAYLAPTASLRPPAISHQAFTSFQDQTLHPPVSEYANTASLLSDGNWKGLLKYWGITALQIGIQAAVNFLLPGAGVAIGSAFQSFGASMIRFATSHLVGQGILNFAVRSVGSSLIHFGATLVGPGF